MKNQFSAFKPDVFILVINWTRKVESIFICVAIQFLCSHQHAN